MNTDSASIWLNASRPARPGEYFAARDSSTAADGNPSGVLEGEPDTLGASTGVAVIGAGYLGVRIAAELLLLGVEVSVFDKSLAAMGQVDGQNELDAKVFCTLLECSEQGLLQLAGMQPPAKRQVRASSLYWEPVKGEGERRPRWSASLSEAVRGKAIVIESVPDVLHIKAAVFTEAAQSALPGVLLATSTLTLPLSDLQTAVNEKLAENPSVQRPRVVGLRFLAPVVFVPFVEVTLTAAQEQGQDRQDLMALLAHWGKGAFICDVQGAAAMAQDDGKHWETYRLGRDRLRLDERSAFCRQQGEARLRHAHRQGPEAVAQLTPSQMFDFRNGEERCCICLTSPPSVTSLLCGHRCMCSSCAEHIETGSRLCPICRCRFARSMTS